MSKPAIQILGIYKQPFSKELYAKACKEKYGEEFIPSPEELDNIEPDDFLYQELSHIVLIEVLVENPDDKYRISDYGQPDVGQCAYLEEYLDETGTKIIGHFQQDVPNDKMRIAFFLHHFDDTLPLETSYGVIPCPPVQEMPERLSKIIHYEPVD